MFQPLCSSCCSQTAGEGDRPHGVPGTDHQSKPIISMDIKVGVQPIIQARDGGKEGPDMGKGGPSIYALCLFGQNRSSDNWHTSCQSIDHTAASCPARLVRKRGWMTGGSHQRAAYPEICLKYNKFNGDCKFSRNCRFQHACSRCGKLHPVTKCGRGEKRARMEANDRPF